MLGRLVSRRMLRTTAASRATLAELAFPVTAALLGVGLLGASLTWTQWLGMADVVVSVTALSLRERSRRPVVGGPCTSGRAI